MKPERVLLVDDEEAFLLGAVAVLSRTGRQVDTADSLEEAERLLGRYEYEAVITDLRLAGTEGEEGLEIASFVRSYCPKTKLILITAYGDEEVKKSAMALGVDHYFEKPVRFDLLEKALDEGNGRKNSGKET